ncbi:PQQ-binding-like beta-propeller repeat protein [Lentisphaera marina]|uniref:outer membrane protein assembly factor BamB family protein n=1 Tax=Lentisphaera marina TaxID=1111041 RepID=UPI002367154F|nr:PQQ-binding-like beta-propeller repeat protein [Lentisphaera marina]MDD7983983.1 PQQ-binding-like beta-propeller repeat protein [Lentisphaera marina]
MLYRVPYRKSLFSHGNKITSFTKLFLLAGLSLSTFGQNWPQASGPNANYQVEGNAPKKWSVVRNENIKWRTPMPEAGQAAVTVWGNKVFTTVHKPINSIEEKTSVTDIIAYCMDAETGEVLWTKDLPGSVIIDIANGFSDATVFAPLCDGEKVWFFNRCGRMACYDMDGNEQWVRDFKPRYMHKNRQAEPFFVGDTILYVEMADKKEEFTSIPRKDNKKKAEAAKDKGFWTYVHGIDKNTGKVLWREKTGTVVHCNPVLNTLKDGTQALVQQRGGPHAPVENPAGITLMSLDEGKEGEEIWSKPIKGLFTMANVHWNKDFIPLIIGTDCQVLSTDSGEILRKVSIIDDVTVHRKGKESTKESISSKGPRKLTYNTEILVGNDYYFLSFSAPYLGKVNLETGSMEYLELPAQLIASPKSAQENVFINSIKKVKNVPVNQKGLKIGAKGHDGAGFGHLCSASPILVGKHLIIPVVTGTVYVIDTTKGFNNGEALVAVNDLGEANKTWTLSTFSHSKGRLYTHTMKEVICIENNSGN